MTIPGSMAEVDLVGRLRRRLVELEQLIQVEHQRSHEHLQLAADVHRRLLPSPMRTDRAEVDVRYQPSTRSGATTARCTSPARMCATSPCATSRGTASARRSWRPASPAKFGTACTRRSRRPVPDLLRSSNRPGGRRDHLERSRASESHPRPRRPPHGRAAHEPEPHDWRPDAMSRGRAGASEPARARGPCPLLHGRRDRGPRCGGSGTRRGGSRRFHARCDEGRSVRDDRSHPGAAV